MYNTLASLINDAESQGKTISSLIREQSANAEGKSEGEKTREMRKKYDTLKRAHEKGVTGELVSKGGLCGKMASMVKNNTSQNRTLTNDFVREVIWSALAISENSACMSRTVAIPTAGACGIVPACLFALGKHHNIDSAQIVSSFFIVNAIKHIIEENACILGADGGCQAECGSAAAMAAAAMVELMGGSPSAAGHACAFALASLLGLICDPVAGLVEYPCVIRNASCAMVAISAAEMALAGIESPIPVDEVITKLKEVGDSMPWQYRETAAGGLANTIAAKEIEAKVFGKRLFMANKS